MATGLTYALVEGKEPDFWQFANRCAQQLSPFYFCRDRKNSPELPELPELDEETTYAAERRKEAEAELRDLEVMTDEECATEARNAWEQRKKEQADYLVRHAAIKVPMLKMQKQIRAWNPPEALDSLKTLMLEQLKTSGELEEPGNLYCTTNAPESGPVWKAERLAHAHRTLAYHQESIATERAAHLRNFEYVELLKDEVQKYQKELDEAK